MSTTCCCEFCKLRSVNLLDRPSGVPARSKCGRSSMPPQQFYDFIKPLGRGASGEVFEARRKSDGQVRAIKMIPKCSSGGVSDAKRLAFVENEITCWSRVKHKNIVLLDEVFTGPTHFGLVQELVTGGELFDRIVQKNHYSEYDAAGLLAQILDAVQHLHEGGVIHRDLKPENLLMSDQSEKATIKVADFGLAALATDTKRLHKPVGTPGYLAPEVVRTMVDRQASYGKEADVWSIGVILYILLSGCPPFDLEDESKCFDQTLAAKYTFPPVVWIDVSEVAKDLVRRILVADPVQRFTIAQIWQHPFLKNAGQQAPRTHLKTTVESLARFNARRTWRVGIKAVMAASRFQGGFAKIIAAAKAAKEMDGSPSSSPNAAPAASPHVKAPPVTPKQ